MLPSCNQPQTTGSQSTGAADTIQSQSNAGAIEGESNGEEKQFPEEYAQVSDSIMTSGNFVVFFMKNGEWANEIGAEEAANDFAYNATEAMDSLDTGKIKNAFLIGDEIKIGLENGTTFKIIQPECVMGVVMVRTGSKPALKCGVESAVNFWRHYMEYFKTDI